MKKHHRTILCQESLFYVAVLAFVFGAAMVKGMNLLVLLAGMLLGPLIVSWRSGLATLRGLRLRRRMPHGVSAGDPLVVSIDITSTRRFSGSWAIAVEDEIHREGNPNDTAIRPGVWFPYIAPRQSSTQLYRGRLPRRGKYHFAALTASTRFPFGLLRRSYTVAAADSLVVYPRLGRLAKAWNAWRQEVAEGARRRERYHGRASGDFFGVREWHQGDSRRWIHWRSSARHGTLVVRQFERRRNRQYAILLDLWQPRKPAPEEEENVELAVSFAATLVSTICQQETNHLLLGLAGREPDCFQGPVSASLREDAMRRLALVEASHEDWLPRLLDDAMDRIEPGAQIVLVSTRSNDLADVARFGHLGRDSNRRMLLRQMRTVSTADPQLTEYFQVD